MTKDSKDSSKDCVRDRRTVDLSEVEKVFRTPNSPKSGTKHDVHLITNEKKHRKVALKHAEQPSVRHEQSDAEHPSQPLLEPPRERPKPPLAGPEIDDLDDIPATPQPGVDDGLLDPGDNTFIHHEGNDEKEGKDGSAEEGDFGEDGKWKWPSTGFDEGDYPYDINGLGPRFGIDDRPLSTVPGSIPDVNTYQQKKNLAQGMMDLALLSANANQLRYVLESATSHPYYYPSLALITLSIIFQIAVGVGLIMNSRYNVKDEKDICKADKINNMTVLGVFLITTVNVFITSFSVATNTSPSLPPAPAIQQVG